MSLGKKRRPILKKNINIEDAGFVEEKEIEDEFQETAKNLNNQKTVNVKEEIKNADEDEETIDFYKEDEMFKHTSSTPKESKVDSEEKRKDYSNTSSEQFKKEMEDAERIEKESYTPEYFAEIAEFLITLIDTGFSSAMKWWSKDISDAQYSLSKPKQNKLIGMLTRILFKYQAKFSLEFMFFLTILVMYIPGFASARQRRKELKKNILVSSQNQNNENLQFVKKENESDNLNSNVETVSVEDFDNGIKKETRGRKKKVV